MRKLIALFAFIGIVTVACSTAQSPGFSNSAGDEMTRYELGAASTNYDLLGSATAKFGLGDSLLSTLPSAARTILSLLGNSVTVKMDFTASAKGTVETNNENQVLTLEYQSLQGSIDIGGKKSDVTLDDLSGKQAKYNIGADGSVAVDGADPLADKFWLTGSGVGSCPSLQSGGAKSGATWTTEPDLGLLLGIFGGKVELDNTYTVNGNEAEVKATTDQIEGLSIDTAALIKSFNDALGISIEEIDVKAAVNATGSLEDTCKLSIPAQDLLGMSHSLKLNGSLDVSGSSLPADLKPGSLFTVDLDSKASLSKA